MSGRDRAREYREFADKMFADDLDYMVAAGDDLDWLIAQLTAGHVRVDPERTTNDRFVRMSAAATLRALLTPPVSVVGEGVRYLVHATNEGGVVVIEAGPTPAFNEVFCIIPPAQTSRMMEAAERIASALNDTRALLNPVDGGEGRKLREALELALPIIEAERNTVVECHTNLSGPNIGKVTDEEAVEAIERMDAALSAGRAALATAAEPGEGR